ncbi:MAG: hypothetical protein ABI846_13675 [Rudaea sp.]
MFLRITVALLLAANAATLSGCGGGHGAEDPAAIVAATPPTTSAPSPTAPPPVTVTPLPPPTATPALGVIDVAWVAPTIKADGTPLDDLAGFRILVGTSSGTYTSSVTVADPTATTFPLVDLPPANYYVVVVAYDAANNESLPSAEASKAIR